VLGTPITVALRVTGADDRRRWILPFLHSRAVELLSHPLVAIALFAGSLWVTHFSAIYELALENGAVHDLEHALYLAAALLFWWPIVGADPTRWRIPYPVRLALMLIVMAQGAFLGIAIMDAQAPLYPHYAGLHLGYITPLADQQAAGLVMMAQQLLTVGVFAALASLAWTRRPRARRPVPAAAI